MENHEEFEKRMQGLKKPTPATQHQAYLKVPILNTRKSAAIGWWLVLFPLLLLAFLGMKEIFKSDNHVVDTFFDTLTVFDRAHGGWFSPLLFFLFPLIAAGMNLLSLLNIIYDRNTNELIVTIKLRFWNLFLIGIGTSVALIIGFYAVTENMIEKSMQDMERLRHIEHLK
ncbi:hypothetical protein [Runella zeae]|uniref:hypothetical protein n=1 Tax=Runella zeae TaxID=94255 RepID=UPI000406C055|nr:hypothetical protein [Runella zeae]